MQIDIDVLKQAANDAVEAGLSTFLTVPEKRNRFGYDMLFGGEPTSPMQNAVSRSMSQTAEKMTAKILEDDVAFTQSLEAAVKEAVQRALVADRDKTVTRLANAIAVALGRASDDD